MAYPVRLILLLILIPGIQAVSQEKWTLDRCIRHAFENNIQLKQQELGINLAENNLLQSRLQLLPDLGLGANQSFRFGRSVDPLTYEFTTENFKGSSFYGNTELDIFNGLRNINTIKRNRLNLEISLNNYERARNDLSLNITRFYLGILFDMELQDIARQQVETTGLQIEKTRKLVEAGALTRGDLLEIQAQQASEELMLVNAGNQLRMSLLNLAQLLDIEDVDNFYIDRPSFENTIIGDFAGDADEIFMSALEMMPQVKSAELELRYQQNELAITRGRMSPSLSMNAAWGSGYSDNIRDYETGNIMAFRDQLEFASTTSLGFNLQVPVFSGWATRTAVKNSRIALLNSQYQLELVKNQLKKEIQQSMADAGAALVKYNATQKSLTYLEQAFSYTEQKYSSGLLTALDYNIAKNNLVKAQSELLQAKYNYIFNLRILDFYRGIPVELR